MQDSHVLCMFLHLHKTEKKKKTVLETYLKYRMIVYTCQVETETKKKEESEIKLIYYILILLLEFPLK